MRRILFALSALPLLAGCFGFSSVDNELIGQVKFVKNITPLILPGYFMADISLGVMRNGAGSMSRDDKELFTFDDALQNKLKRAAETGEIVKLRYRQHRVVAYGPDYEVTAVEPSP